MTEWIRATAARTVYYHGTFRKLTPGTILTPASHGEVPGNFDYAKLTGMDQYVSAVTTPEAARTWGAFAAERHAPGAQIFVYAVEPLGLMHSGIHVTMERARVLYEVDAYGKEKLGSIERLPDPDAGYGGYIQEGRDRKLYIDGQPVRKLYRVAHPDEWAAAQAQGFLQSHDNGYTRASAAPDDRWRYPDGRSGPRAVTLEIDYDPSDRWIASAEGYAATHERIPLSRVRKVASKTAMKTIRVDGDEYPVARGPKGITVYDEVGREIATVASRAEAATAVRAMREGHNGSGWIRATVAPSPPSPARSPLGQVVASRME